MSENCKCGGNCESTREEFNVKSIEKALEEKKIAAAKYRDSLTKMTEVGAASRLISDLAAANKRAESEVIRLEAILAEARQAVKNKSEVSLEQKRNDAIQKIKDGSFDFLASYGLVEAGERAALDRSIDAGIKEIIAMVTFAGGLGMDLSKVMSEATKEKKEKSKVGGQRANRDLADLAELNNWLDELMKGNL